MKTQYTYIHFELLGDTGKTTRWCCRNTRSNSVLGGIYWNGAWRQYCFHPFPETVFSSGCLEDIQDFIGQLMEQRRKP